jgi:long-chain acyl-CoA synthetase
MGAGGAATSLPVLQFFEDIGIPIMEGYGLTETSPVITAGSVDFANRRLGTVGVPIRGVDVKIVDPATLQPLPSDTDGEITVTGPIVMKGYRNNQKANDEVFFQLNGQRYFRTGDLGRMVEGKFLKITGRIKEQFKLENGKFVVPAPLEDIFSRGPMLLQSFLYGENKKFTILLVVPNYIEVEKWAKAKHPELVPLLPKEPKNVLDLGKDPEENKRLQQLFESPAFTMKVSREVFPSPSPSPNHTHALSSDYST